MCNEKFIEKPNDRPLSDYFCLFKNGTINRKELEGKIYHYLLSNPGRYNIFQKNDDRWSDFLSWLYSRLSRAVDIYKETGSSFDAYITGLIHGAAKEYRSREADHSYTEYVCWQARAEEMKLFESEPEYFKPLKMKISPDDLNPRQLLFLLLKSYYCATDEMVSYVAKINRLQKEDIRKMIDEIRVKRMDKELEYKELQERLHLQYHRCLSYQKRLSHAQPGTDYHFVLGDRLKRAKKRFASMKIRLGKIRQTASNRLIAEILGIPLGTVDSGLSSLKNRLSNNLLSKNSLSAFK